MKRRDLLRAAAAAAACAAVPGCIPESRMKRDLEMEPQDIGDGWQVARPEDVGLSSVRMREAYGRVFSEDDFINALSLLVVSKGKLVAEGYVRDAADRSRREHVQSVTKSLTSLAFGIARDDGFFPDLDAPVARFLDVRDDRKRGLTLRHLLTMRSGLDIDNTRFAIEAVMDERRDITRWLLDLDLASAPGERFVYRDPDSQLIGAVIRAATGRPVDAIVGERVFAPLGIRDTAWEHDADGDPFIPFGAWLRPRDLARVIELVRRRGDWGGQRIVSAAWLDEATRMQVVVPPEAEEPGHHYGFYFWIVPELEAYAMRGHGGQILLAIPSRETSIILTSTPDAQWRIGSSLEDVVALAKIILSA